MLLNFVDKNARWEEGEENNDPHMFVLGTGVRHGPSKEKSIGGSFVTKNNGKKGKEEIYRNIHAGLGRQLQEVECILADDDDDVPIECSPPYGQDLPAENYNEIVLFSGLGITKWHGCMGETIWKMYLPPTEFDFHVKALCIWKDSKTLEWRQWYGNVDFYFNIRCAEKLNRVITVENVNINDDTFFLLTPDYMCF